MIIPEDERDTKAVTRSDDSISKENIEVYRDYKSARAPRYRDMVENDRFYHNQQFTETEEADIIARGQAPLAINVTYSIVKQIVSLLTGGDPIWNVDPVGEVDKQYAYTFRSLLQGTWYNSRASRHLTQIAKETAIVGVGYGMVNPVMDTTFGMRVSWIPYHQVYPDPGIADFDYNDADNIIISKVVSFKRAAEFFRKPISFIEKILKDSEPLEDDDKTTIYPRYISAVSTQKRARIIQRLSLERRKVFIITPKQAGGTSLTQKVYFELSESLKILKAKNIIEIREEERKVLVKYISIGKYGESYPLPIDTYNIIPFIDEFNGNPFPLGEVDFLYGLQRALNKFIMLAILNATLSNNMKVMAPKGQIDKTAYEENYAIPGSLIEYEWQDGQPPPQPINPMPLSGEFFAFPQHIINIMEYITGIFGVMQGNPQDAPRTASGLISLQNYGGQKVKLLGRNINEALSSLGDVAIALFQNYAPYNQVMSYFEGNDIKSTAYNTIIAHDGGNISIENDLSVGKFRTRVNIQQNYGGERQQKAQVLANLAAQTKSPSLIGPILKLADIPEADEIAEQIDALSQAQQSIAQLQEQLQRMEQVNRQLENEVIQKSQKVQVAQFQAQLDKLYHQIKGEVGVNVADQLAQFKSQLQTQTPTQ